MPYKVIEVRSTSPNATSIEFAEVIRRQCGFVAYRHYTAVPLVSSDEEGLFINDGIGRLRLRDRCFYLRHDTCAKLDLTRDCRLSLMPEYQFDDIFPVRRTSLPADMKVTEAEISRAFLNLIKSWASDADDSWIKLASLFSPDMTKQLSRPDAMPHVPQGLIAAGACVRTAMEAAISHISAL